MDENKLLQFFKNYDIHYEHIAKSRIYSFYRGNTLYYVDAWNEEFGIIFKTRYLRIDIYRTAILEILKQIVLNSTK